MAYSSDRPTLSVLATYVGLYIILAIVSGAIFWGLFAFEFGMTKFLDWLFSESSRLSTGPLQVIFTAFFFTLVVYHWVNDGRYLWRDALLAGVGGAMLWLGVLLELRSSMFLGQPYFGFALVIMGGIAMALGMAEPSSPKSIAKARNSFPRPSRKRKAA